MLIMQSEPTVAQRYHLEIWIEKSTANEVLQPLGRIYGVNIAPFVGEVSATACEDLVDRAIANARPVRVFYISDFDPGGLSMPTAAARKIEYYVRKSGVDLDIRLYPLALTHEQCVEHGLPRTPIKETDLRGEKFEARFGAGATELDALQALRPGTLRDLLVAEIERYVDDNLDDEVEDTVGQVRDQLRRAESDVYDLHSNEIEALNEQRRAITAAFDRVHGPAWATYNHAIQQARVAYDEALEQARAEIEELERRFTENAESLLATMNTEIEEAAPDVDDFDWPEPAEADEGEDDPLYDSTRKYLEQLERYRVHQGKPAEAGLWQDRKFPLVCQNPRCGKDFTSPRATTKVCSDKCRNAMRPPKRRAKA
jgi:hypothetical protein